MRRCPHCGEQFSHECNTFCNRCWKVVLKSADEAYRTRLNDLSRKWARDNPEKHKASKAKWDKANRHKRNSFQLSYSARYRQVYGGKPGGWHKGIRVWMGDKLFGITVDRSFMQDGERVIPVMLERTKAVIAVPIEGVKRISLVTPEEAAEIVYNPYGIKFQERRP